MPILNIVLTALSDTRISTLTAIRALSVMAEHADEHGNIQPDANGELITDPEILSAKIGVTKNSIFHAFNALVQAGYIDWQKARGRERSRGITGRVRILVPSSAQ